jgi:hypothetical protein
MNCTTVSSSWSAGNGNFYVEAVVITEAGKSTVYRSPALTAEQHETERCRVCRALQSLDRLGSLSLQALALEPGGILEGLKKQFAQYLSEDD